MSIFYRVIFLVLLTIGIAVIIAETMLSSKSENYYSERDDILKKESSTFFAHNVTLTSEELMASKILVSEKISELEAGYKNSSDFLPSLNFIEAKTQIDKSQVFSFIQKIPKGASLHTHLLAAVSVDFLINRISYKEYLYGGYVNDVFKLKFLSHPEQDKRTTWFLIKDMRTEQGPETFDKWLKEKLLLIIENTSKHQTVCVEKTWKKFKNIFTTLYDMLSYKPVFQEYIYQLLDELYNDNVFYTELKGTIMPLYELNGTQHTNRQFFEIFTETVNEFKRSHPDFLGVKYIHSVYRGVSEEILEANLKEIIELQTQFPQFIAGFDFVGFEEEGRTLLDYAPKLLQFQKDLKFFFHAGETPWFGHTDLNLVDAILLKSFRIGHGLSIVKHPKLMELGRKHNIPLEICPISNQVLMSIKDPRYHPAATLMAFNYPIIICNDDPSIWNATGLSYDWYIAFMAMTPKNSGLEILKQFAYNSIIYSAMNEEEKNEAMRILNQKWDAFLDNILQRSTIKNVDII